METIRSIYSSKYSQFDGRASRREFWIFVLWVTLVGYGLILAAGALWGVNGGDLAFLPGLLLVFHILGSIIPLLALRFRRLHDIDKSAWWVLIGFVPFIGAVVMLVFDFLPGTTGPNRFGPDPKGLGGEQAAEVLS